MRPIKTECFFVAEISAGAETKEREAPPVSLCPNRKIGSDCSFHASELLENCSFSDRDGTRITLSLISLLLLLFLWLGPLPSHLLWLKPAMAVAKQIGVSKTSLLRVCKRLRIPKPTKAQRRTLTRGEKVRSPALPSFGLTSVGASPEEEEWYFTLKPRTPRWLARAKVRSIAQVLQLELHSRIPTSVRREIGDFEYSEQIKGGFDPRTPLNRDERQMRLMNGGL